MHLENCCSGHSRADFVTIAAVFPSWGTPDSVMSRPIVTIESPNPCESRVTTKNNQVLEIFSACGLGILCSSENRPLTTENFPAPIDEAEEFNARSLRRLIAR